MDVQPYWLWWEPYVLITIQICFVNGGEISRFQVMPFDPIDSKKTKIFTPIVKHQKLYKHKLTGKSAKEKAVCS